jgi:hypothetical protein
MNFSRKEQYRRRRELLPLLNNWYGKARGILELSSSYTQEAVCIGEIMQELCENLRDKDVTTFIEINTRWQEIFPGKLSGCVKPSCFKDGVLYLEVRHSALVSELAPSLDLFLSRIATAIGEGKCKEIKLASAGNISRKKRL